jgi:hypothetical protein
MWWSEDVVVSVLFPYLLPSLPICKTECWSKQDIRRVLEHLSMFYCDVPLEGTRELLETFVRRVLSVPSSCKIDLDDHLRFLAEIEKRSSFQKFELIKSSVHSLYSCIFLIEHKVNTHGCYGHALRMASFNGHKDTVALLLEHKADVHAWNDSALKWASEAGQKDIVALLLERKADVNANDESALRLAGMNGHKDTVTLLLENRADLDRALELTNNLNYKHTPALLLEYKARKP